jgi:hypothetical protein
MIESRKLDRLDYALCAALWLGYLVLLLSTVKDLGYARDEGFYFQAARSYEAWFELLHTDFSRAVEPGTIDRYWSRSRIAICSRLCACLGNRARRTVFRAWPSAHSAWS